MKRKLSYLEIALLIVGCLLVAKIYTESTREPYEKGLIYGAKGKFESARETFAGTEDDDPRHFLSVRQLKMTADDVLRGRIKKEAAIHVFRGARYHTRYQTHGYNGSEEYLNKAIEEYRKAIAINPDIAVAHHALGIAYERKFRSMVIEEYKKAIAIDPDESLTHYLLGSFYHLKEMHDEAIKEMKKAEALGIEPTSRLIFVHKILGTEYLKTERYDLAVKHFEKAIQLGSKDKWVFKGLYRATAALKQE